jgi:hypothetical protein
MQFAIGVTVLEFSFVKHNQDPLKVNVGICGHHASKLINYFFVKQTI